MRRLPTWLHVLLSFALIFNGMAAAQASTRMLLQHAGAGPTPTKAQAHGPETAGQVPPCHAATAKLATEAPALSYNHHDELGDSKHTPDCCKAGACRCQCVHQAQSMGVIVLLAEPTILHTSSVRAMQSAHPEALLPHLIRPPIG